VSWEGRYLEDFTVGDFYRHPLGRTVLEVDNAWLTLLTQNTAAVHFDRHYASGTQWGKPLVDSTFTLAHGDDLAALAGASQLAGIVLPKTESPDHVAAVAAVLGPRISVFALLETARGVRDGGLIAQAPWTANMIVVAGQTAARTTSIACLSNCVARSSPEWTMWLCMDRRAASASRARRFSSIAE
jgi:citrate lyase beta subunit